MTSLAVGDRVKLIDDSGMGSRYKIGMTGTVKSRRSELVTVEWEDKTCSVSEWYITRFEWVSSTPAVKQWVVLCNGKVLFSFDKEEDALTSAKSRLQSLPHDLYFVAKIGYSIRLPTAEPIVEKL